MNTDIRIFVSYRRADSPCFAERIRDWFMLAYQRENVFMDFDAIPPFVDFEVFIVEQIEKVDVMLVIIGPRWLDMLNQRMQTDELDYVRMEIRQALQMEKLVAPIVVDGAQTPRADDLPPDIRPMMRANIPRLDSGRQFLDNIERIISALPKALDQHTRIKAANDLEAERMVDPIEAMTFVPFSYPHRASSIEADIMDVSRSPAMPPPRAEPAPMAEQIPAPMPMPKAPIVAIYSTVEDEPFAQQLQADLAPLPIQTALNQQPVAIALGIILLSNASRQSDWIQGEIARLQEQTIPILPLLIEGDIKSAAPYAIAANEIIDMQQGEDSLAELMKRIGLILQK